LSSWFRDYVYIPLGGNRVSDIRHYAILFFVFILSGIWHGANYTVPDLGSPEWHLSYCGNTLLYKRYPGLKINGVGYKQYLQRLGIFGHDLFCLDIFPCDKPL
jgi:hypothetical protein